MLWRGGTQEEGPALTLHLLAELSHDSDALSEGLLGAGNSTRDPQVAGRRELRVQWTDEARSERSRAHLRLFLRVRPWTDGFELLLSS